MEKSITEEDLKFILGTEFEKILDIARFNSFCSTCMGKNKVEMVNLRFAINDLNDLLVSGSCKTCNKKMGRYMEIGEVPQFSERTKVIKKKK